MSGRRGGRGELSQRVKRANAIRREAQRFQGETSVYQYFDERGALLYVGVTSRGIRRMHEHSRTKDWWHRASGARIEHFPNRDAALAREAYLIAAFRPPFNTAGINRQVDTLAELSKTRRLAAASADAYDRAAQALDRDDLAAVEKAIKVMSPKARLAFAREHPHLPISIVVAA